jgi:hypothetical protein
MGKAQLEPEEVSVLRATFDELDIDQSGTIDADEISQALARLGMPVSEAKAEVMLRGADVDHSGCIDFDEFLVVVERARHRPGRRATTFNAVIDEQLASRSGALGVVQEDSSTVDGTPKRGDLTSTMRKVTEAFGDGVESPGPLTQREWYFLDKSGKGWAICASTAHRTRDSLPLTGALSQLLPHASQMTGSAARSRRTSPLTKTSRGTLGSAATLTLTRRPLLRSCGPSCARRASRC